MLRWGVVVVLAAVAACVESRAVPCGDTGLVCAEGTVCRQLTPAADKPVENRCMQPAQLETCAGRAIGDACDAVDGGRCYPRLLPPDATSDELVCLPVGCGNGRVDEDRREQCDDTNAVNGDGCSASCLSDETCGNGIIDGYERTLIDGTTAPAEQCDDHNARPHDGCSAACTLESPRWTRVHFGAPAPRSGHTLVATERGRAVLFGGHDANGAALEDTWEWDGQGWREARPSFHPSLRAFHMSAYDPVRHVVVVFGGDGGDPTTWAWDGARWSALAPPVVPPGQRDGAMAFDRGRARIVLFGGQRKGTLTDTTTWEWDGATWMALEAPNLGPSASGPPAQAGHAMAYDPARDALVLVGIAPGSLGPPTTTVWEYAGNGLWNAKPASGESPPPRTHAALTYDSARGALVLTGGEPYGVEPPTYALDDAWAWDGTGWTKLCDPCGAARTQQAVAYDPAHGLVMFGGLATFGPADTLQATNTTLGWSQGAWAQIPVFDPDTLPFPRRVGHATASDPLRARVITCCDNQVASALSTSAWSELPAPPFSSRQYASLVYDPVDDVHVLFGGGVGTLYGETYTFDGSTWTLGAAGPSARYKHAAAWLGDRMVMFGGEEQGPKTLDDLWTWNPTSNPTWTNVSKGASWPAARSGAAMAVDGARQRVVMFGGVSGTQRLDDTWEWDGTAWGHVELATRPTQRAGAAMAWDPATRQLILFGGDGGSNVFYDDTWAYDGTAWRLLEITGGPSARTEHTLVASPDGRGVILYGGRNSLGGSPEVWRLRWESHASEESCSGFDDGDGDGAKGCADDECWAVCAPLCPPVPPMTSPASTCTADAPRCGDGTCGELESCRACPGDCGACPAVCGDLVCDPGELCPGDCL